MIIPKKLTINPDRNRKSFLLRKKRRYILFPKNISDKLRKKKPSFNNTGHDGDRKDVKRSQDSIPRIFVIMVLVSFGFPDVMICLWFWSYFKQSF